MNVQTVTNAILLELERTGIKKWTLNNSYASFYRSFCKKDGYKELNEALIISFLAIKHGKDIWNFSNSQLNRSEQKSKRAFSVLHEYFTTGKTNIQCRQIQVFEKQDEDVLQRFCIYCSEQGNVEITLLRKRSTITRFLRSQSLAKLELSSISAYIHSFVGKTMYYQKRELEEIRKFLEFCFLRNFIQNDFQDAFPNIKAVKGSKLPSVYTDKEIKELLNYFSTRKSINTKRDYAMAILMIIYGFRSIDISLLDTSSLDFDKGVLSFLQSKTKITVVHKLQTHVGNSIIKYILEERPDSCSTLLFLKKDGTGLSSKSVSSVIRNAFIASNVDIGNRRHGSHSLRHSLASSMINEGCSIFTIANILGQTSAETARLYSKVNLSKLSLCALEVPSYE